MADKKASLILELKDLASSGISKVSSAIGGLRTAIFAATAAIGSMVAILAKALNAYGEQELAITKLNQALENQGIKSQSVTNDLIAFANQMQKTTVYADEVVLSAMALGTTFGLTGDKLKATTQAAADMSAALGIDLKTTMLLLGKASVGETGTLSRYGIVISENIPKAEKFAAALSQVNNRFGGSAIAQAGTYSGQLAQMKNTFDELLESMGKRFVGPATSFLKWIKDATVATTEYLGIGEKTSGIYGAQIDNLNKLIKLEKERIATLKEYGGTTKDEEAKLATMQKSVAWYEKQNKAIEDQNRLKAEAGAKGPAVEDEEATKLLEKAQLQIDTSNLTENELENIRTNAMANELIAKGEHNASIELLEAQQTKNSKAQNDLRAKNMASTLSFISTMSNSHNKTLASVGKAAAVSMATIDTFAAANKALASAPPPWNFALAGLVTAAGMANVAQISGIKLAEGGMVMPKSGGTSAIMAEAGRPEVAIPLDDDRTKDKLRDVFGGGSTIVINAGAVIADEYSLNEFVEKIDEKLYERQRNKRSYT